MVDYIEISAKRTFIIFYLTSLELPVDKWLLKRVLCLPEFDENLPEHKKRQWPGAKS